MSETFFVLLLFKQTNLLNTRIEALQIVLIKWQVLPHATPLTFADDLYAYFNAGSPSPVAWPDAWTQATSDGLPTAQFEHTLLVTDEGAEILTLP